MKVYTRLALTIALTASAFTVQGAPQADQELSLCKAEIHEYYDQSTELQLVDRRRDIDGVSMRIAARLDADNARFVTCWVPRGEESVAYAYTGSNTGLASNARVVINH